MKKRITVYFEDENLFKKFLETRQEIEKEKGKTRVTWESVIKRLIEEKK